VRVLELRFQIGLPLARSLLREAAPFLPQAVEARADHPDRSIADLRDARPAGRLRGRRVEPPDALIVIGYE